MLRRVPDRIWPFALIGTIAVLAATLRFYRLTDRSLWLDEIFTAKAAHLSGPGAVIAFAQADIDQMPLFYMFTWLLHPWGDGAFVLRLQSALAGTLAVLAVFWLGRRLFGIRAAGMAAVLMAVMPYAVWYSQEARNYALFMLLSTVQMLFAYMSIKRGRWFDWAGLTIASIGNIYNHYLALEMTAVVIVYCGGFLLAGLLRNSSTGVRLTTAVGMTASALAAALIPWRPVLKTIYLEALSVAAEAKNHRLAAVVAGFAVFGVVAILAFAFRRKAGAVRSALSRPPVTQTLFGAAAGLAVAIAYAPWLPYLRVFLSTPTKGLGRLDVARTPDLGALVRIPSELGLTWFLLVAYCVGLVGLSVGAFEGRSREATLLLSWIGVPLILLSLSAHWAIVDVDLRYFALLFPAVMLVTGAGTEMIWGGLRRLFHWVRSGVRIQFVNAVAGAAVITVLLAQALPALSVSYQAQKNDWRTAAEHIAAASSPGVVVIAIGNYSDWVVLCLQYYFREMHSPVAVVDGMQMTSDTVDRLAASAGPTWGVIDYPSPKQLAWIQESRDVRTDFVDVTGTIHVVRSADPSLSPTDQARQLLNWELSVEPQLSASAGLLDLRAGHAVLGPDLVRAPTLSGWYLPAGARADTGVISLSATPSSPQANAYFTLSPPPAGHDFVATFDHRNASLRGSQSLSVFAFDRGDHVIAIYPSSNGYVCQGSDSWTTSYFAFTIPDGATALVLVLRADGTGTAEFRSVQVNRLSEIT